MRFLMLTLRALHPSRLAMLSAVAFGLVVSSSSQRRPRAIDATNVARFSERIGRSCCGRIPSGTVLLIALAIIYFGLVRRRRD